MLTFSNEDLRGKLAADTGTDASGIDFLPFSDLEQSVRDDVARIQGLAVHRSGHHGDRARL